VQLLLTLLYCRMHIKLTNYYSYHLNLLLYLKRRRAQAERNAEKARLQGMVARNRRARINLLEAMELHKADEMHLLLDASHEPRDSVPPLTRATFQKVHGCNGPCDCCSTCASVHV